MCNPALKRFGWVLAGFLITGAVTPCTQAATIREREPNNERTEAIVIQPGDTVEGSFSVTAAKAARQNEDPDRYRITNLVVPGIYTVTVTPAVAECEYYFGSNLTTTWWGSGQGVMIFEITGQKRTNITQRWPDKPERRSATGDEPTEIAIYLANKPFEGIGTGGWRCVKNGQWFSEIPYRLSVVAGTGPQPPPPPPPPQPQLQPQSQPQPRTENLGQDISIAPGASWEGVIQATNVLDLLARIGGEKVAGGNFALDVSVNGQRLSTPLRNKSQNFKFADGRTFPYYDSSAQGWMVFYSPDFSANNSTAGGGYQVMTDPGQAYRYQWDIGSLIGRSPTVRLRLSNNGRTSGMPIIVRMVQSGAVLSLSPPPQGKTLRVLVQDEQGHVVPGAAVRVGAPPCAGEATSDAGGVAVLRMPPGCP